MTYSKDDFSYPYFDESLDIESRIADLISRMTVEEKVAQLTCTYGFAGVIDRGDLEHGIGQVSMSSGSLSVEENIKLIRSTQKFLLKESRLKIPAFFHVETLNGIALKSSTVYPVPLALAATWNPDLLGKMASEMAENLQRLGIHIALAPVLDIARDPRWGRLSETYGESVYLVSQMGKEYVKGLQYGDVSIELTDKSSADCKLNAYKSPELEKFDKSENIEAYRVEKSIPCAKHFVAYAMGEGALNMSQIHFGEREIRETYASPFETAIKEAALPAVMNAYSAIDGEAILSTPKYLQNLLRDKLNFKGLTISDYASINMLNNIYYIAKDMAEAAKLALESGLDTEAPAPGCMGEVFVERLKSGEYDEKILGRALYNILKLKFKMGLFDEKFRSDLFDVEEECEKIAEIEASLEAQKDLELETSLQLAEESIVLLKNDCLPINVKSVRRIAIIGEHSRSLRALFGSYTFPSFYEGMKSIFDDLNANMGQEGMNLSLEAKMALRSHISELPEPDDMIRESYSGIETIAEAISSLLENEDCEVELLFADAVSVRGEILEDLEEACRIAGIADYTIFCCGGISGSSPTSTMGENIDSSSINLIGEFETVALKLAELSKKFVLLHMDGRPLSSERLFSAANAVLELWHPGQMGAKALADTLFGFNNPSGKLPVSLLRNSGQIPLYVEQKRGSGAFGRGLSADGRERSYFDVSSLPLRAFGFGLSYSNFELSDCNLPAEVSVEDEYFNISFSLKNISDIKGKEIIQIYCNDVYASLPRPMQSLIAFAKIELGADEAADVNIRVPIDLLAFLNKDMDWIIEDGDFSIMFAKSSDNILFRRMLKVKGSKILRDGRRRLSSEVEVFIGDHN